MTHRHHDHPLAAETASAPDTRAVLARIPHAGDDTHSPSETHNHYRHHSRSSSCATVLQHRRT